MAAAIDHPGNSSASSKALPLPLDGRVALVTGGSRGIGASWSTTRPTHQGPRGIVAELGSRGHRSGGRVGPGRRALQVPAAPPHIVVACARILNPQYPKLADMTVECQDQSSALLPINRTVGSFADHLRGDVRNACSHSSLAVALLN
jgi:hypothetical protein